METDLKELIRGFIYLKEIETGNLTMACDAVETYLLGTFYDVQQECIDQRAEELFEGYQKECSYELEEE